MKLFWYGLVLVVVISWIYVWIYYVSDVLVGVGVGLVLGCLIWKVFLLC